MEKLNQLTIKDNKILASFNGAPVECQNYNVKKGGTYAVDAKGFMRFIPLSLADWTDAVKELSQAKARPKLGLRLEHHEGDLFKMSNYALTGRVPRADWDKIKPHMVFKDMRENGTIISGGNFYGWVVRQGHETEVKTILNIS